MTPEDAIHELDTAHPLDLNTAAVSAVVEKLVAELAQRDARIAELEENISQLMETFVKVADFLAIDTKVARNSPGKPSDVFIAAIKAQTALSPSSGVVLPERMTEEEIHAIDMDCTMQIDFALGIEGHVRSEFIRLNPCRAQTVADDRNPMQPIVFAEDGVIRFKQNRIVRHLLDFATPLGCGLNELARQDFTQDDHMQLAQLIGYSVSGYGDLSYASPESVERADEIAAVMLAAQSATQKGPGDE